VAVGFFLFAKGDGLHVSVKKTTFAQLTDGPGEQLFPSLAPDGKSLVYASKVAGNWDIYSKNLGERDATNLTRDSSADDTQPAISPDGKSIAFRSDRDGGGIFIMDKRGNAVRRLTDGGYNPGWSPDGKAIVYADESVDRPDDRQLAISRLWIVEISTGRKRLLSNLDGVQPRWSPHGNRIAYWAIDRSGYRDIWTISTGGGQPIPVMRDPYVDWSPVWSPDGKYLYFSSDRGDGMNVWRVPIHENSGEILGPLEPVSTPSQYVGHLDFARDGRHLAYMQQVLAASVKKVSFDPLTGSILNEPVDLTPGTVQASRPSLSPDGQWVAFNSVGKQEDIFIVRADGGTMRQLTDDGAKNRGPQFSPDGKRIAFFSKRTGTPEIWTVDVDGTNPQQVTFLAGPNVAWPIWSPDKKRIIYTIFGLNSFDLELGKPWSSSQPQALPALPEHDGKYYAWAWSPDGKRLAGFQQREDGTSGGILVYELPSSSFTKVSAIGSDPVWLSDSKRLIVNHRGRVHLVNTATKATREILSVAPNEVAPRGLAISKDNRTIYFSVTTTAADIWMMSLDER
jgi:Tol biopolymer transport system component